MLSRSKFEIDELVDEMLDRIPVEMYKRDDTTFMDPAMGGGQFIAGIIKRLRYNGHNDENIASRVYGFEKADFYIAIAEYERNIKGLGTFEACDVLEKDFGDMKFDVIVGNPPYQSGSSSSEGKPIWHLFASLALDQTKDNGYVCLIHPAGYRTGKSKFKKIFDKLNSYQFEYIKLSNYNTGVEIFGVNTTCDWYVLRKEKPSRLTDICDVNNIQCKVDMSRIKQLPDANINKLKNIADLTITNTVEILYDTAYHTQKAHMSDQQTDIFKFPVVYTLKKEGPRLWYSSKNDLGHYNVPKVIMARGMGKPVLDLLGEYAICQFSFAIIGEKDYLCKVYNALRTKECIDALTIMGTGNGHNYLKEVVRLLHKDFWKEFVNEA